MTTTQTSNHPMYLDEADVRGELTRVFDVCHSCRLCHEFCASFPTLFDMIERRGDQGAGALTPADQDRVVDACFQCKQCSVDCPYTPELHERQIDFPRMMLRARAMQHAQGLTSWRTKRTTRVLARRDLFGKFAMVAAPLANRIVGAAPGSLLRRVTAFVTGVSSVRRLSPYAQQRFSAWFNKRPTVTLRKAQGRVTVYPTCLVEYRETSIGQDLVKVYERNGIECHNTAAGCCGAPWLHAGDIERFSKIAEKNVKTLAAEIRSGADVVVPQPMCSYVLKQDYVNYVSGPTSEADAKLVAEHTYDAAEYLMSLHRADDTVLNTEFHGATVRTITYHSPSQLRAQHVGFESRDLLKLTGARVKVVQRNSGVESVWGLRAENEAIALPIAKQLGEMIDAAGGDLVAGDCHLTNTAIAEQTGRHAQHPLQVLARAYGIAEQQP